MRARHIAAGMLVATCLLSSLPAAAGTQSGQISYGSADQTYAGAGVMTIKVNGAPASNQPACATDARWSLNPATNKTVAPYLYALILTAMSSGWQVLVTGTGQCSSVSNVEEIAYIEVVKP